MAHKSADTDIWSTTKRMSLSPSQKHVPIKSYDGNQHCVQKCLLHASHGRWDTENDTNRTELENCEWFYIIINLFDSICRCCQYAYNCVHLWWHDISTCHWKLWPQIRAQNKRTSQTRICLNTIITGVHQTNMQPCESCFIVATWM